VVLLVPISAGPETSKLALGTADPVGSFTVPWMPAVVSWASPKEENKSEKDMMANGTSRPHRLFEVLTVRTHDRRLNRLLGHLQQEFPIGVLVANSHPLHRLFAREPT